MNQKHSKEYKSIGQTIKKYRKLRGLTQEQLADMVCIALVTLPKSKHLIVTSLFHWK